MKLCRNIASKKIFVFIKEDKENQAYFISPDGRMNLFEKTDFDEFIEATDEIYLKEYMVITDKQYRRYRNYTENEVVEVFKAQTHRRL